ncbi:MAG TPA: bifunctional transaldolase/phosoglucose isomerase, partial [Planctomycetota bacterium]|nr:bifunctional transaldolase/phosoglucose isomerase [Planctomycetota bacterium]
FRDHGKLRASLEVSPYLANDTQATIADARRLWKTVARPNVMIKIPATDAGVPAIEQMVAEGVNINVTLLFSSAAWEQVALAYIAGLERWAAEGGDLTKVASVASFFVSRIDSVVDKIADERKIEGIRGKVAIANAKLVYQRWKALFAGPRWEALAKKGARKQRLLWASTGTKDKRYSDVLYVEELIGPETVNTVPPATYDAFRDHGKLRASLEEDVPGAHATLEKLAKHDVSLDAICKKLVDDGVQLFADAFDKLLGAVERKRAEALGPRLDGMRWKLPEAIEADVKAALEDWRKTGKLRKLWEKQAALWTGADEAQWLGWLGLPWSYGEQDFAAFRALADDVKGAGFTDALLIGMGGSSLCPDVLVKVFGEQPGFPRLHVLDSTDPAQIAATEKKLDLAKTLVIVASKSGSTLEPNILKQYFFERVKEKVGAPAVGRRFIAITDPGSKMEAIAKQDGFRHVFHGLPSVGGRFSALSRFGLVPAAVMGLDVKALVERAADMAAACGQAVPPDANPGVLLGTILGVCAKRGRDKVTFVASPALRALGGWLEQLIAESTGKEGKGIVPVDLERLGPPGTYGDDRVFVQLRMDEDTITHADGMLTELEGEGHPVVRISLGERVSIGQEFFRWEMATAVAGAHLGINPFNQPDVEAAKVGARALMAEVEKTGALPAEKVLAPEAWPDALRELFAKLRPRDYFAVLAYIEMSPAHEEALAAVRHVVRDRKKVATCLGFGPRFLHSTGQLYKGGPASGVFLQLTCGDEVDLGVPGQKYTFGQVKAAQARGDLGVLEERGRRTLHLDLGRDVARGLRALREAVEQALR